MSKKHWSEESRDDRLQRQYSITEETYNAILKKQDGRCAICKCHQHYQRLAVDHDHKTGMVRGLLCVHCNRGLGRFFDSALRLRNAAAYIEKANETWAKVLAKNTEVKNESVGS
jgi:NMD protein affecting ribosome stability and mRNA decay